MKTQILSVLRPPVFDHEDQTRAAGVLHVILLTLFVVFAILAFFTDHPRTVLITAGMSALSLGLWAFMRRGYVQVASWGLMGILVAGITLIIYFNGSIRVPAASGFVACIVVAGLTLGKRATIGSAVVISAILYILYRAEVAGWLPPVYYQATGFLQWATYAGILCVSAVLLILTHSSILNALKLARYHARAFSERNQELQIEIAERQQIEKALRESEERYRTLISTSPDGIAQTDLEGKIIFVSSQLLKLFGLLETSQVLQTEICAWIAPEDQERARENIRNTLQDHRRPYSHYTCIRQDNSRLAVEVNSAPWRNTAGEIGGAIFIVRDITERMRAEQALRESEERYRTLFELESDALILIDVDTLEIWDANPAALQLYHYNRPEFLSMCITDLFGEAEQIDLTKTTGQDIIHIPLNYHHDKSGNAFPVEITGRYFDWQNKKRLLVAIREITERVRTEEALQKRLNALTQPLDAPSSVQFADLFDIEKIQAVQDTFADATGVASIITYPDGTPITRPSNFCRLCIQIIRKTEKGLANCYYSDAVLGKQNIAGPTVQPCLSGGLWDAGASITVGGKHIANWLIGQVKNEILDETQMLQYAEMIGADRDDFRQALSEVPIMSKEKFEKIAKALFLLATELSQEAYQNVQQARFITERQRMEKELREHREQLEELVLERTAQLTSTNKELEAFSYSVAHDLRTPLRAIDGFSRVLLEDHTDQLDEQGRSYLKRIMAANQRMGQLIDDLLDLSRLTRSEVKREQIDLSQMAHAIIDEFRQREPERDVDVVIASRLIVEGDQHLLHVVLENLLSNAWKFTAKTPKAYIEFGVQTGKHAVYFVRDNGAGFDMTYSAKLFGAFQRLHTEGEFPGTGIGLATVKRIMQRHGGDVWATGEVNQGATFYFTFP